MQVERIRYGSNFFELVVLFLWHFVLHRSRFLLSQSVSERTRQREREQKKREWDSDSDFHRGILQRISCLSFLLQHFRMIANNFIFIFFCPPIRSMYFEFCSFVLVFIPSYFILLDLPINKHQVTFANANIFPGIFFLIIFFLPLALSRSVRYWVFLCGFSHIPREVCRSEWERDRVCVCGKWFWKLFMYVPDSIKEM